MMSKRSKIIITVAAAVAAVAVAVTLLLVFLLPSSDRESAPTFAKAEYTVADGQRVTADGADSYVLIGNAAEGVSVTSGGVFTVSDGVTDGTQVLLGAVKNGKVVCTAVCTLSVTGAAPVITFDNLSSYVINGERVSATATPARSLVYSVKTNEDGITVDRASGKVSFAACVEDGAEFTVTATAGTAHADKTFKASIGDHASARQTVAICEYGIGGVAEFTLDYDDEATERTGVIGVSVKDNLLSSDEWTYDATTCTVKIHNTVLKRLLMGENSVKIFTSRNTVNGIIKSARYIKDAESLAAVNYDKQALSDYYVMVADVDLTDYLATTETGWAPIGIYRDVQDGTAAALAFNGTFDGNGHTVSGFWSDRNDDYAYNGGLFGYVTANAQIMNVKLVGDRSKPYVVKSFSGVLVGSNCGIIKNCAADVDIVQDEGSRMAGAFVGRNEGTISDCYSLGKIADGTEHGAFCGDNSLGALVRCYAVNENELPMVGSVSAKIEDCKRFSTKQELIDGAVFAASSGWIASDGLPELASVHVDYELTDITVRNTQTELTAGETLKLDIVGEPAVLFSYDKLMFCVTEGDGVIVTSDGVVVTEGAAAGRVVIEVRCAGVTRVYTFTIKDKEGGGGK